MQRILVTVLCGSERHQWVHPKLSSTLVQMALDQRYETKLQWISDARPVDYARNSCIAAARDGGFDWLIMIDNACAPSCSPLEVIATAPDYVHVVGLPAGIRLNEKLAWNFTSPAKPAESGRFQEVNQIGAGCLILSKRVWQVVSAGPWFKWITSNDELCSPAHGCGEDIYFCNLLKQQGFTLWAHNGIVASHYRTTDLTQMVLQTGAQR